MLSTAVPRRHTRPPRRVVRLVIAVAVAGVAAMTLGGSATADSAFTMKSTAMGVSLVLSNPGFPLVQSIQTNTPTAEAQLNSRGQGSGYSAAPDPGQDVAELYTVGPSQLCGILASNLKHDIPSCAQVTSEIPAYPYAFAQSGDQPDDQSFGGAHLHAEATDSSAEAQTIVGAPGAASAVSTARAVAGSDGSTVTTAATSVDSLELGNAVRLTGIRSVAKATRDVSGHLKLDSSFSIGHLHVSGLDVGYDDGTFTVLGQPLAVPVPVQAILSALKTAGVTARFMPSTRTKTGITSGGLSLSFELPGVPQNVNNLIPQVPVPLPIGVGAPTTPTTVTYVLGRTEVASTYVAIPGDDLGGGLIGGTTGGSTPPPVTGTTGGASTPPITGGTVPPPTASSGGPVVSPPTGTSNPPTTAAAATGLTSNRSADIYLAVVLAALAVFGSASAIRYLGVRLSWTS